jgi:preprotein translocase subunit SecE
MNAKVETEGGRLDSLKLGIAVLILGGGIYAFYHFEEQLLVLRVLGLLALAGISIFIAAQSAMGKSILGFITGAQREVRRVVWPSRAETMQTTLAVVLMVLLVGIFLWLLDMLLLWAIQLLTGQGS